MQKVRLRYLAYSTLTDERFYYVLNFKKFLYVFDVFGRFKNFFSADFFTSTGWCKK